MIFNPQPKKKAIRLKGAAYAELRWSLYERERGICQGCRKYVPMFVGGSGHFDEYICGHVSHVKSRGAGGDDTLENTRWKCFDCHRKEHNGRKP